MSEKAKKSKPKKKRNAAISALVYVVCVIGASVIIASVGWIFANDVLSLSKTDTTALITLDSSIMSSKVVEVDGEKKTVSVADVDVVADILKEKGLIEYPWVFKLFCAVTNSETKIRAGVYELDTSMDYQALVRNMSNRSATRITVKVTIPEGYELDQTFALLEAEGVCTAEELYDMSANWDYKFSFLQGVLPLGDPNRLEGYLFPDTYEFYYGDDPKTVINKMLLAFDARFNEALRETVKEKGMTMHEIVTIASMIERETDGTDQATISSVIYNRLEAGMRLQIDATVQYALDERKPSLSYDDLEVDSPYNTYKVNGLPAGPIANPGMASIMAAINPEDTSYLYYKVGEDGKTHVFFKTYEGFEAYGR